MYIYMHIALVFKTSIAVKRVLMNYFLNFLFWNNYRFTGSCIDNVTQRGPMYHSPTLPTGCSLNNCNTFLKNNRKLTLVYWVCIVLCHFIICVKVLVSCVQLLATPWTVAHEAPLIMGFSRESHNQKTELIYVVIPFNAQVAFTNWVSWERERKATFYT